jgi:hypothetical protein
MKSEKNTLDGDLQRHELASSAQVPEERQVPQPNLDMK